MIIYFEGLRCSGKTTLIENCTRNDIVRIYRTLPKGKTGLNLNDFTKQDEEKCLLAISQPENKVVLVDRCYLSTVLYYTVMQETRSDCSAWPVCEWLIGELGATLRRPDFYVFVDTPIDECVSRAVRSGRYSEGDLWFRYPERMLHWYERLFAAFEPCTPVYRLDGRGEISTMAERLATLLSRTLS